MEEEEAEERVEEFQGPDEPAEAEVRDGDYLYDVTVDMASGLIVRVESDGDLDGDV